MSTKPVNYLDLEIKDNNPQWVKFVDYFNQRWEEKFKEPGHFEYKNRFDDVHIISKKMQFVEWLVLNDKINLKKLDTKLLKIWIHKNIWFYEGLIMILAIQDNPITFILKLLK